MEAKFSGLRWHRFGWARPALNRAVPGRITLGREGSLGVLKWLAFLTTGEQASYRCWQSQPAKVGVGKPSFRGVTDSRGRSFGAETQGRDVQFEMAENVLKANR